MKRKVDEGVEGGDSMDEVVYVGSFFKGEIKREEKVKRNKSLPLTFQIFSNRNLIVSIAQFLDLKSFSRFMCCSRKIWSVLSKVEGFACIAWQNMFTTNFGEEFLWGFKAFTQNFDWREKSKICYNRERGKFVVANALVNTSFI